MKATPTQLAGALIGLLVLLPSAAWALTLDEAIALAMRRNEVPRIAEARLEQARAQRRLAIARLLPSVVARGSWSLGPEITRDLGGGNETVVQPATSRRGAVDASLRLLDPAAIPLVTAAARDARAQEAASEDLRRSLAFEVADGFVTVQAAEAVLEAARRRVKVAQEAFEDARSRLEAGLANRNDVTRIELELSNARLGVTNAEEALSLARIALGYLLTEQVDEPLAPLALPMPEVEGAPEELADGARERRPDLIALQLQTRAADARDDEPMLRLLPSLDLAGTWNVTDNPGFSGSDTDWRLTLGLTWELYDGGARYAEARFFDAQTVELQMQTLSLSRQVGTEIAESLVSIDAARLALQEAELRERVARQNEEEVVLRFEAGLATALEQADAIAQRFEAEAEVAQQALQLQRNVLQLRAALGFWPLEEERG